MTGLDPRRRPAPAKRRALSGSGTTGLMTCNSALCATLLCTLPRVRYITSVTVRILVGASAVCVGFSQWHGRNAQRSVSCASNQRIVFGFPLEGSRGAIGSRSPLREADSDSALGAVYILIT